MHRYDKTPTSEERQPQTNPPEYISHQKNGLHLTNLASVVKARASSITSDSSTTSDSSSSPLLPSSKAVHSDIESLSGNMRRSSSGTKKKSHRMHRAQIKALRLAWIIILLLGEHGAYWVMLHRCVWPENPTWDMSDSAVQDRYRIAIIADPQLTDWYSYKQRGLALWLTELYTDIFMRRSFSRLHRRLQPDAVLFLGDLVDGARESIADKREEYEKNKNRFLEKVFDSSRTAWNLKPVVNDVFDDDSGQKIQGLRANGIQGQKFGPQNAGENAIGRHVQVEEVPSNSNKRATIRSAGRSLRLYVAGNHDVGFGDTTVSEAVRQYKQDFGSLNYEIVVGNHSFVVLDTLALSANLTSIQEESLAFLTQLGEEIPTLPRILFTHVPLFRLETTPCGESRESQQLIMDRSGEQFQNMVNVSLSRQILRKIRPDMVFSGDDHDWCEIAHALDHDKLTPEATVRTFSFAQGIRQPAFVMLSLYNPERASRTDAPMVYSSGAHAQLGGPTGTIEAGRGSEIGAGAAMVNGRATFAYDECMLPNQFSIYFGYIGLFGLTLAWLMTLRWRWFTQGRQTCDPVLVRWRQAASPPSKSNRSTSTPHPLETRTFASSTQGSTTATKLSPAKPQARQDFAPMNDTVERTFADEEKSPESMQRSLSPLMPISMRRRNKLWAWMVKRTWPVRTPQYWTMLSLDLWDILRYVVPFYLLLLVISLS